MAGKPLLICHTLCIPCNTRYDAESLFLMPRSLFDRGPGLPDFWRLVTFFVPTPSSRHDAQDGSMGDVLLHVGSGATRTHAQPALAGEHGEHGEHPPR